MNFWLTFVAYEAVWFIAVIGAGQGLVWPGAAATLLFAAWRLGVSRQRAVEARLVSVALAVGLLADALLVWTDAATYTAAWPWPEAPFWLTALWIAFALTIVPLFGYLHARPWLAALFGMVGGPLAYLGAARGWQVVRFNPPEWHALVLLGIEWGIALPLLCTLAHRALTRPARALPIEHRVLP